MTDYYVIGDVHGKAGMLEDLLKTWDGHTRLLFLGDLIDRGEDSRRVLEMVKDLVDNQGAICLSGNHEYMFLTWLDNPEESYDHYLNPLITHFFSFAEQLNGNSTVLAPITLGS